MAKSSSGARFGRAKASNLAGPAPDIHDDRGDRVIGVLTGLRAEARCLRGLGLAVACSGARPGRARAEAARLLADGASGLVSFGLAAGLAPTLRSGDLILAEAVVLPDGRRLACDPTWRQGLAQAGIPAQTGAVAGTDRLLVTPLQKRVLLERTGALAADMESHVVAALASAADKPFVVVRAISDPADQALPGSATRFLGPQGRIRPGALLGILSRPRELAALIRLGIQTRRALATLSRVARRAGGGLQSPFRSPRSGTGGESRDG